MKVTTERTPDCNAIVTVQVDDEQMRRAMKSAAQRVSRARPLPGFRPGKAPYEMVERAVGKELLLDEAIDELARSLYKQVLKDEKIEAYDAGTLDIPQKEPLVLKFTIPTRPTVKLGDYHSIHLRPKEINVDDSEVDQVLERLQREQAQLVPVTRPTQIGDLLTIDLKGGFEGEEPVERQGLQVPLEKEKPVFPWMDQLVGASVSETRTVTYTYPTDAADKAIAGKTATYTVSVTDIKEPQLPALDDEFAKSVSEMQTLEQLNRHIRTTLREQKEADEENRFADQVVDALVEQSQIAFPASMLDDELNIELARSKQVAAQLGLTWEKYLTLAGKTEAAFREEARPRAEKSVKRLLALLEFMKAEKIEVSSKEVDVEIDRQAQTAAQSGGRASQTRRTLSTPSARKDVEWHLQVHKAIERLVAMARGEPTSGKILTPEMLREEERAREQTPQGAPNPGGLITDPSKVREEDWPRGLTRPLIPGQEK